MTAIGSGQALTGAGAAEGLRLEITGGSLGGRGSVNFSQGYAHQLNQLVNNFVGTGGLLSARTGGLTQSVVDISTQRDALNRRLSGLEQRLRAQFTALDQLISRITSTGNFLTQQLRNLPGSTRNNN